MSIRDAPGGMLQYFLGLQAAGFQLHRLCLCGLSGLRGIGASIRDAFGGNDVHFRLSLRLWAAGLRAVSIASACRWGWACLLYWPESRQQSWSALPLLSILNALHTFISELQRE